MAAMSMDMESRAASFSKDVMKSTTSYYAEDYNHMLCGLAVTGKGPNLEAYAQLRSHTCDAANAPQGASATLDSLCGEAHQQVRLSKSFIFKEVVPTSSMVLQKRTQSNGSKKSTKMKVILSNI